MANLEYTAEVYYIHTQVNAGCRRSSQNLYYKAILLVRPTTDGKERSNNVEWRPSLGKRSTSPLIRWTEEDSGNLLDLLRTPERMEWRAFGEA